MIGRRTELLLHLSVPAWGDKDIFVTSIEGTESLSDLYRYEIEFTSEDAIDPNDAIGKDAKITIEAGDNPLVAHGILVEFSAGDLTPARDYVYHCVLAPKVALLALSRQNLVYGADEGIGLKDLIDNVLTNKAGENSTSGGHGLDIRHELRMRRKYPERKQVVQYGESDLAFLSRHCEHDGVFFFFEHGDDHETIVFGDKNDAFKNVDIDGSDAVVFNDKRGSANADNLAMSRFRAVAKPVPGTVFLRDYNETKSSPPLKVSETVTDRGFGKVVEYGLHFEDEDEGKALAKIRAEEIACRHTLYVGTCNAPHLRAGTVFTLAEHPLAALSDRFLVIAATHSAAVQPPSAFSPLPFGPESRTARPYTNVVTCIKLSTPFRPERKTPKPNVSGLHTARIDAEQDHGKRGWMDDRGRYKVHFAFDDGEYQAGKASDFVRQSQPYLGPNATGMHFPLVEGTEVVVGYLNGDPDRPIVVGAVSDEKNDDPVTKDNHTRNRLVTASNVMMEIDDREASQNGGANGAASSAAGSKDAPYFRIDTPAEVSGRSFTGTYLRMGKATGKEEFALLPRATQQKIAAAMKHALAESGSASDAASNSATTSTSAAPRKETT